jgi:hypothetical protein
MNHLIHFMALQNAGHGRFVADMALIKMDPVGNTLKVLPSRHGRVDSYSRERPQASKSRLKF